MEKEKAEQEAHRPVDPWMFPAEPRQVEAPTTPSLSNSEQTSGSSQQQEGGKKKLKYSNLDELRVYEKNQKRAQRARELPEQRELRLQKAREYKVTYKRKTTTKEKEATRERVAAIRANRTEEQISQEREAARQRMANIRSRRRTEEQETNVKRQDEATDDPKPGTSREVYVPTVDIPEEMSEYDKIRQKNIEERQRKFQELELNEAKKTLSNSLKFMKKARKPHT